MTTPVAHPHLTDDPSPGLRLVRPASKEPGDTASHGWPGDLFDRWLEAWAERACHLWTHRGWCGSRNVPYL